MLVFNGQPGIEGECENMWSLPRLDRLSVDETGNDRGHGQPPPSVPRLKDITCWASSNSVADLAQVTLTRQNKGLLNSKGNLVKVIVSTDTS